MTMMERSDGHLWLPVCRLGQLTPERGSAALIEGKQIALFRTHSDQVFAVQNLDPFSGAMVMSRGIVGSRDGRPTVASPMYKQVFDLASGECLDAVGKEPRPLRTWPVRISGDSVLIGVADHAHQAA